MGIEKVIRKCFWIQKDTGVKNESKTGQQKWLISSLLAKLLTWKISWPQFENNNCIFCFWMIQFKIIWFTKSIFGRFIENWPKKNYFYQFKIIYQVRESPLGYENRL